MKKIIEIKCENESEVVSFLTAISLALSSSIEFFADKTEEEKAQEKYARAIAMLSEALIAVLDATEDAVASRPASSTIQTMAGCTASSAIRRYCRANGEEWAQEEVEEDTLEMSFGDLIDLVVNRLEEELHSDSYPPFGTHFETKSRALDLLQEITEQEI